MLTAESTKVGTTLLIVDGQADFHLGGSLAVPNSDVDAERIASLIRSSIEDKENPKIRPIVATMDSHHVLHIAHPKFWSSSSSKEHPEPFVCQLRPCYMGKIGGRDVFQEDDVPYSTLY